MAALSRDLGRKPLARTVADTPVVLFRTATGEAAALVDRCPHRNYPLSDGAVADGGLQCPYHGWRFGPDGACLEVPGCALAAGDGDRLAATPVEVREVNGAVLVRLESASSDLPNLGPWGAPDHDHFWWSQGEWRGRTLDALENVLDPFHTNFIHDGIIRHTAVIPFGGGWWGFPSSSISARRRRCPRQPARCARGRGRRPGKSPRARRSCRRAARRAGLRRSADRSRGA